MITTIDDQTWQDALVPGTLHLISVGTGYCDENAYTFTEPDGTQHDISALTAEQAMETARDFVLDDGEDRDLWG